MNAIVKHATFGAVVPAMELQVFVPAALCQAGEDPEGLTAMARSFAAGFGWGLGWFGFLIALPFLVALL